MAGFLFGGDTGVESAAELARKREIVNALLEPSLTMPQTFGEGLTVLGRAIAGKLKDKKLSEKEDAERARVSGQFDAITSGLMGGKGGGTPSGTWTPDAPKPDALEVAQGTMQGGNSFPNQPKADLGGVSGMGNAGLSFGSATMTPQEMLIEGAKARGLNPIDVATAISYETGGKFDPMMAGPTTQWGTHRGLIQFGEPQAAKYGADFTDPNTAMRSQLDPTSGAVWNYLDQTGVKPGMGLPEIYSAINAGAVGRMGASDAGNGGAPGTVADKVAGMGDHRVKAAEFLGGTWTPNAGAGGVTASAMGGQPPMDVAALSELAANPYLPEGQRAIVGALLQQAMTPPDPMAALELEKAQLELDAMKNPKPQTPETLTERQALLAAAGIDPASPEGQNYILTGDLPEAQNPADKPASVQEYEYYRQGAEARGETPMPYEEWTIRDEKASVPPGGGSDKQIYDTIAASSERAATAAVGLGSLAEATKALNDGAITGFAADQRLYLAKLGSALGITDPAAIENTETFRAAIAPQVSAMIKATVGSANISNADREFAEKAAAGSITLDEASIKRMIGVMEKMGREAVRAHNAKVNAAYPDGKGFERERALFLVPEPSMATEPKPVAAETSGKTAVPATAPEGIDPELWAIMTDEEKALWAN